MQRLSARRLIIIGAACILLTVATVTSAAGATRSTSSFDRATAYLATHPGGTLLNDNEISYGGGTLIITLTAAPGTFGSPDCPQGWYCFYDRPAFGYPRGKLSSCGWQDLATWGWQFRIDSVYYNLSRGYTVFYYYNYPLYSVGAGNRSNSDVAPNRNMATHVQRVC